MTGGEARGDCRRIFEAAVGAVDPYVCVMGRIETVRRAWRDCSAERLLVIAFGKGAHAMCRAAEEGLADLPLEGIAVTKYGHGGSLGRIRLIEAAHPIPDEAGEAAAGEVLGLLRGTDERTLVLCLISGGGSALLAAPAEGITLADKQKTTDLLLRAGAEIGELNAVRKHLSRVKGGRLAAAAYPSPLISLILSDVIGDPLDVIASGPTAPDESRYVDALRVIDSCGIKDHVPPAVLNHLGAGAFGMIPETPKGEDPLFGAVANLIVGNNELALDGGLREARALGYEAAITSSALSGEAREVASQMAASARERLSRMKSGERLCLLSGGETTVTVRGRGKGGRNMELALSFAREIAGTEGITLLSAGTDGTDGPTDAAGGIVDGRTARAAGGDPDRALRENDSYTFLQGNDGLLVTGPTGTNVMDVQVLLLKK